MADGLYSAIRDVNAHALNETGEQLALEQLASFSLRARWIDSAKVATARYVLRATLDPSTRSLAAAGIELLRVTTVRFLRRCSWTTVDQPPASADVALLRVDLIRQNSSDSVFLTAPVATRPR